MKEDGKNIRRVAPGRLITYCGLFCGDCPRFGGKMSRLARELRRELEVSGMAQSIRTGPTGKRGLKSFETFWSMLGTLAGFDCPGCRKAGCSVTCRIRPCSSSRGYTGCWECAEFATCREFRSLRKVHGSGIVRNLKALARKGPGEFLHGRRYWLGLHKTGTLP